MLTKTLPTDGDYATVHARRFDLSFEALLNLGLQPSSRVLEVGGEGPFTARLREYGCDVLPIGGEIDVSEFAVEPGEHKTLGFNVAYPWQLSPRFDARFDFVLCMEVLEHLKDTANAPRDHWTNDGLLNCLHGCKLALKPETGWLFISTPNVCGYKAFDNLIREQHPFAYPPHVREMGVYDLRAHIENAGMQVVNMWTVNAWDNHGMVFEVARAIDAFIRNRGANPHSREDCIFAAARRAV